MSLTNQQYDSLMREYDHKQIRNHHIVAERTKELYSAIPELSNLDAQVAEASVSSIAAILNGKASGSTDNTKSLLSELKAKRESLIKSAGFPADYLEAPYDCPDCKDTGFIGNERCHCFKQAAINIVYQQSNLKEILKKENFSHFDISLYDDTTPDATLGITARAAAQRAYKTAFDFIHNFKEKGGNLLLLGQTGCGKTFLSNCIAKELLDKGVSVVYFTAFELFNIFEKQTFKKDVDVTDIHDHIFDCDLLIIDDLGTEFANSFTNSRLFQCLNERMLRGKSTIISTNYSLLQIREQYSERITSRVISQYTIINLKGDDIRVKKVIGNK